MKNSELFLSIKDFLAETWLKIMGMPFTGSTADYIAIIIGLIIVYFIIKLILYIHDEIWYFREKRKSQKVKLGEDPDFASDEASRRRALSREMEKKGYSAEDMGRIGEEECAKIMSEIPGMKVLPNVYLFRYIKDKMESTECDIIGVSNHMLYLVEVKNYDGIVCPTSDKYWLNITYDKHSAYRYSPIEQNAGHEKMLRSVLGDKYPDIKICKIVAYSDRTMIEKHAYYRDKDKIDGTYVCNFENLKEIINKEEKACRTLINKEEIVSFFNPYLNPSEEVKRLSLENAKSKGGR